MESDSEKPICYDLYCGLGGWSEAFIDEGYRCIGFDIEAHDYGTGGYPGDLILRDVRSIHGAELKDAAVIVASPPCTEPSYRAMPWKRAKELNKQGPPHLFIELFNACFRIQREASEAAHRHIPLVVENVLGAQVWVGPVGPARWHFGSFYLWGDVPALMPIPKLRAHKFPEGNCSARNWGEREVQRLRDCAEGVKSFTPNGEPLGKILLGENGVVRVLNESAPPHSSQRFRIHWHATSRSATTNRKHPGASHHEYRRARWFT